MGRRKLFSDDDLRGAVAKGLTRIEAAKHFGCSEAAIRQRARKLGLKFPVASGAIDKDEFLRLANAGLFGREIAAQFGVHYQYVMAYARKLGVKLARPVTKDVSDKAKARLEDCKRRYLAGETLQQIGDAYGLTRERVRQILTKNYGIRRRDGGLAAKAAENERKRSAVKDAKYQEKHGCSYRQYLSIVREERRMKREGAHKYQLPRAAYCLQRNNARTRGIGWELTLWDWWVIWQQSGKWAKRGRGLGGYCMCRRGDQGPYSKDNVFIAPNTTNLSEANRKDSLPVGVMRAKSGRYVAKRRLKGRTYSLGTFDTPEEAHLAFVRFRGLEAAE